MYIFLAFFSGFTILLSIIMLGKINQRVGLLRTSFVSFSVGTVGSILLMLVVHDFNLATLKDVPYYLYFGFIIVISITMINGTIINKIPATYATILVFVGQLTSGIIIDYLRFGIFSFGDLIGGILIILGLVFNNSVDKKRSMLPPLSYDMELFQTSVVKCIENKL